MLYSKIINIHERYMYFPNSIYIYITKAFKPKLAYSKVNFNQSQFHNCLFGNMTLVLGYKTQ